MPALANPQYEVFAIARARGALLEQAYQEAGYAAQKGHAWRIAGRAEIQARIAELRAERARVEEVFPRAIIDVLVRQAKVNEALQTPAASRETRANLLEALRLERAIADARRKNYEKSVKTMVCEDDRPPADRHPTAIEPPTDRPPAALPAPADRPATAAA